MYEIHFYDCYGAFVATAKGAAAMDALVARIQGNGGVVTGVILVG